jgi:hypothetical protein
LKKKPWIEIWVNQDQEIKGKATNLASDYIKSDEGSNLSEPETDVKGEDEANRADDRPGDDDKDKSKGAKESHDIDAEGDAEYEGEKTYGLPSIHCLDLSNQ